MRDLLCLLMHLVITLARCLSPGGARAVAAESLILKQQLIVINRTRQRAPNLTMIDRFVLGFATLFINSRRRAKVAVILSPATLLKFHKALVDRKYRTLFSSSAKPRTPGPKGPSEELIAAIVELKRHNPKFGYMRIAQQIAHTFGIELDKDVVRRVLSKYYHPDSSGPGGPSWLTLLAQTKDSLWSVDLFRCESILLRSHWVMLVMDIFTRRIIRFEVEQGVIDGVSVCRMFNNTTSGKVRPKHVSTDNDPLFHFHRWLANLRIFEIEEVKSVPYVPISHPFVERLIGTIRREYLDRLFFWNAEDLSRKLSEFQCYYNEHRVHRSLGGTTPSMWAGQPSLVKASLTNFAWRQHCNGLFQSQIAA